MDGLQRKTLFKIDDLEVPLFLETHITPSLFLDLCQICPKSSIFPDRLVELSQEKLDEVTAVKMSKKVVAVRFFCWTKYHMLVALVAKFGQDHYLENCFFQSHRDFKQHVFKTVWRGRSNWRKVSAEAFPLIHWEVDCTEVETTHLVNMSSKRCNLDNMLNDLMIYIKII